MPTTVVMVESDGRRTVLGRLDACCADLALVDALARLALVARRRGATLHVRAPSAELCGLLALAGLDEVLVLEAVGQPETGEQLGIEEVVEGRDPPA